MPDERTSKNQRREQARELARKEREKAQRRERLTKILVPVIVVVALIAVAVTTTVIIINQPKPAPIAANGPKNMISDGIMFTGQNGTIVATKTPALAKGQTPTPVPTDTSAGAPIHITTYIDWACPFCKAFEQANSAYIQKLVQSGAAVLQVMPVAIVDKDYLSSRYASRAANAAACVANDDPDQFLAVQSAFYDDQPPGGTDGFSDSQIVALVQKAGVDDADVSACIKDESFKNWVAAATQHALADPSIQGPQGFATPTVFVNGKRYAGAADDASAFEAFVAAA